ncbi:MAG TPA: methionyl-tRNA formyltransferase [Candidatus Magasanikbacteria bacterium]|nr:methionyl-tRNA formyltransferase [Candidatus Magasanikbacteria bacterium]
MKIIFFGTHDFATTILQGLIDSPLFDIEIVITQPDRPVGRKQELQASPVKLLAEKNNLSIGQPSSLKTYNLKPKTYDLFIVAQYGLLIPPHILNAPQHGTINVHTSLLPKYRGASPIQSALLNGEHETGVTIMKMDIGLDTGPILLQKLLTIDPDDTYTDLDKKLAVLGLQGLEEAVPQYIEGKLNPVPQDDSKATTCKQLSRDDGHIDWNKTSQEIYNQFRAFTPWPGVWTLWGDKRLKLLDIKPTQKQIIPSKVIVEHDILRIGTKDSSIQVFELQLEGKPKMDIKTFLNGYKNISGYNLR